MADGTAGAFAIIAKLERLRALGVETARAAAPEIRKVIAENIGAGRAPDGTKWPDRKAGGRALANADKAVTVEAVGSAVVARVRGVEALHNHGTGRAPARRILPAAGDIIPPSFVAALKRASDAAFRKLSGGAS